MLETDDDYQASVGKGHAVFKRFGDIVHEPHHPLVGKQIACHYDPLAVEQPGCMARTIVNGAVVVKRIDHQKVTPVLIHAEISFKGIVDRHSFSYTAGALLSDGIKYVVVGISTPVNYQPRRSRHIKSGRSRHAVGSPYLNDVARIEVAHNPEKHLGIFQRYDSRMTSTLGCHKPPCQLPTQLYIGIRIVWALLAKHLQHKRERERRMYAEALAMSQTAKSVAI